MCTPRFEVDDMKAMYATSQLHAEFTMTVHTDV
jgi:hypothetical protein